MQWLHDLINNTMQEWKVPGLAIAIVKDNQIIFCEGFGLRDVEKGLKVTPQTLFAIGSCTKAFTTMAMSILVERGKLDWDKSVRNYLPSFKLFDSYVSEHMTPRDLVTHRSGLAGHDFMWHGTPFTRQELFERLQYLEANYELRTSFQYQNLMYMTAGYLAGEISGSSWEKFVQQEIFNPLDMRESNFSVTRSQEAEDFALPYFEEKNDEVTEIPFCNLDAIGPAGSINSNVTDMAKWVLLNLNQGKYDDKQIISPATLNQLHTPQFVIPEPLKYPEILHSSYGLGWFINAYRGHNLVHHGGNIDGFSALTTLLPQDNIGMVILTNLNVTPLPIILAYHVCDRLLGLDEVPWNERIKEKVAQSKEADKKAQEKTSSKRKPGTQPSHPLEDYTGDFEHPAYGILSVEINGNHLIAKYNLIEFELQHYHYDIFEIKFEPIQFSGLVSFFTDTQGNISSLSVPLEPAVKPLLFTRMPEKGMKETSFLEKFVGDYELFEQLLTISLRDNDLVASIVGQPDYELVPYKGTEFNLKNLSGFSIKFALDFVGVVTEAVISQPNGVFTAKKK